MRSPRDLRFKKNTIEIEDRGRHEAFEIALDEISVREADGSLAIHAIPNQADAEGVRKMVRQRIDNAKPQAAGLVLYETGKPRLPQHRRIATSDAVIQLPAGKDPRSLATQLQAEYLGEIAYAPGMYRFRFSDPAQALLLPESVEPMPEVLRVLPQMARLRERTAVPNDTWFSQQWHLANTGQHGGTPGMDINVEPAWDSVRGAGVMIGIVDDGVQASHPDLAPAIQSGLGYDFRQGDSDPSPDLRTSNFQDPLNSPYEDSHGTMVAGVAAGRGFNGTGICGVAPSAGIAAIRLIGDYLTDLQEADAIAWRNDAIAIKNNSWGPLDNGAIIAGPDVLTKAALEFAARSGRGGRGTVFVWSAGNGGQFLDNANKNGYANSIHAIAVGAVDDHGMRAAYSETGCNLLVCAPAGGNGPGTATSDLLNDDGLNFADYEPTIRDPSYTSRFYGTSASAPMVSGVVALMLEANPNLGWRDVQEILIRTARQIDAANPSWQINSAGFPFSDEYGAGLVDAAAAVSMASTWTNLPAMRSTARTPVESVYGEIPDYDADGLVRTFDFSGTNLKVEHVQVQAFVDHPYRGDLEITLISPEGTESRLVQFSDDDSDGFYDWTFSSVQHWGESAAGIWTLRIVDLATGEVGHLLQTTITLHGTETGSPVIPQTPRNLTANAKSTKEIELNWNDIATNETGYRVEFSYGWGDPWQVEVTLPAGTTSYVQKLVPQQVEFHYRVVALNGSSQSGYSNTDYAYTQDGDGAVIYETGFEASEGYQNNSALAGQGPWETFSSGFAYPGNGVMTASSQQGYVGKSSIGNGLRSVTLPVLFSQQPGTVIEFESKVAIVDSTNGKYDGFGFDFFNSNGDWLFELLFDNASLGVVYAREADPSYVNTGFKFTNGVAYNVKFTIDFLNNSWSASINGQTIVHAVSIIESESPIALDFGFLDAFWYVYDSTSGNNYMRFDDIRITQKGLTSPAPPTGFDALPVTSSLVHLYWDADPMAEEYELQHSLNGTNGWTTIAVVQEDDIHYQHTGLDPGSSHYYRLQTRNSLGDSGFGSPVSATTLTEFEDWKAQNLIDADALDSSDDDGDDIPLLMEYALATSPRLASREGLPRVSNPSGQLQLSYHRARSDVLYRVETSTDLLHWTTANVTQEFEVSGRWITAAVTMSGETKRYLRLAVSHP